MYIQRYAEQIVQDISGSFKVLYVGGPRQVGKTTMLQHLAQQHQRNYVSLDNLDEQELARQDQSLFLQKHKPPLLIDEVQYAPTLLSEIKIRVDQADQRGLYWLTGSQQFSLLKGLQESLAGRVGIVHLLGLSLGEIYRWPMRPKPWLPNQSAQLPHPPLDIDTTFNHIVRGSMPALWDDTHQPPPLKTFFSSYVTTYVERDLVTMFGITKRQEFHTFMQLCAARTGQLLNYSQLARDAGVSVHAAKEWLDILQSTSQIYLLRPHHRNLTKRLVKSPKLYFLDTGLAAHLTNWPDAKTLSAGAAAGAFFETLVVSELVKSYHFRGQEPPLSFIRDAQGREIDIVLESGQQLYPVEIKLGSRVTLADARHIEYFRAHLPNMGKGTIISLTDKPFPLNRQIDILPISAIQ